jgi:hypothetical protein
MTTSDKINIILLLITVIGVFAAFRQIYLSNKQKRADLILQLYNQFIADSDMQDMYYLIEYNRFIYQPQTFHMSLEERKLDKLLGLFSNIGQLHQMKIINDKDLEFIKYEFQVIYENEEIQRYFNTLDGWFEVREINHLKFQPFRDIGEKITNENHNAKNLRCRTK